MKFLFSALIALMLLADCTHIDNNDKLPDTDPTEATWSTTPEPITDVQAFPGAEGGGMFTTGGRGGKTLFVTTLEDSNTKDIEGSLRWAVNQPYPRTIIFKVSGIIKLERTLYIKNGNLTIAGQSAPGEGICIRDMGVFIDCDNVIIRYMRFRMGDERKQEDDALGGRFHKNILIDHCSMSWGTDECCSFYANENFTMQWSIIAESLAKSIHYKGSHGFGGIWGGANASFHHNLLVHHDGRTPRFDSSVDYPETIVPGNVDFRNNVIYNWGSYNTHGGEGGKINMVCNYYKQGPAMFDTSNRSRNYFMTTHGTYTVKDIKHYPGHAHLYMENNYYTPDLFAMNVDNWNGVIISNDGGPTEGMHLTSQLPIRPHGITSHVTTHSAAIAYDRVLDYAGVNLHRDKDDRRVIQDTRNGAATILIGAKGSTNGLIDTQSDAGGWDTYKSLPYPTDTDGDGIPDEWEMANGLNKDKPGDSYAKTLDPNKKLTNLEVYLNSLVEATVNGQNMGGRKINL